MAGERPKSSQTRKWGKEEEEEAKKFYSAQVCGASSKKSFPSYEGAWQKL